MINTISIKTPKGNFLLILRCQSTYKILIKRGDYMAIKERMSTTSVQFTLSQYETATEIMEQYGIKSFSEYIRNALDFYNDYKLKN